MWDRRVFLVLGEELDPRLSEIPFFQALSLGFLAFEFAIHQTP